MVNNFQGMYSECVKLSKESKKESLRRLMTIYLHSDKESRKTARRAISRTRNKYLVYALIEEMLAEGEDEYLLLSLGMSLARERYIKRLLLYFKENNLDPKTKGFFANIRSNPLSDSERDQIAEYIVEADDYDSRFINLAGENNIEKLLDAAFESVIKKGGNEEIFELFSEKIEYLELIQDELYQTITSDPERGTLIARYLDLSLDKNQALITENKDLFVIYSVIKNSVFLDEVLYCEDLYLRVAVQIARKQDVEEDDWKAIKGVITERVITDLDEENNFLTFLKDAIYVDREFLEEYLINIYKQTKLYTDRALNILAEIKSRFAYREMLSFMLTSEDRAERYKYAVRLMMTYRENGAAIYNYARDLNDDKLLQTLDEVASKFHIQTSFEEKYHEITLVKEEKIQVLPHDTIVSEFLLDLAQNIKANCFYAAVGFTFASGLKMLQPLLDYIHDNSGSIEIITGSLQNFQTNGRNTKIDKGTILYLNYLINNTGLDLYTFESAFYHGKMYYLANHDMAYVVIGSSNISKTAFLNNYELDTFITIEIDNEDNQFLQWYKTLKSRCTFIQQLDPNQYDDFKWESELDVFSSRFVHKMSADEMRQRITELSDEETRFRLNAWMRHNPSEIFSNLSISSLPEYIVFLFAERGLAVFESFSPGNAYYTFRYFDFDILLQNVSALTKTQMLLSSSFVNRGYHISDKDRLEHKINGLFM